MRVLVTGSHGLIGAALVEALLARGDAVTRLVRGPAAGPGEVRWDPMAGDIDRGAIEGHDAVVHLAGEGIGEKRWTPQQKQRILESRTRGTALLSAALAGLDAPPRVLASGSAVGFYGDRGDELLTEESGPGTGFLADVVRQWESATAPAEDAGIRVAHLRTGIVLAAHGGALRKLLLPFKLGLGGRQGSGRQWWSWITLEDEVRAILHVLDTQLSGPVNLTAPNPARNAEVARTLGAVLHRPAVLPTPTFALEAALGAELVAEVLLAGQRVLPARLEASGFTHAHPELRGALEAVLAR